ncbi:MAG TPA: response regulator [Caldisericia bacterium]|nr:response regulator [Caldisericia bacterium]
MPEILKVLVVDDELGIQKGCQRVLTEYKFTLPDVEDEISFEVATTGSGEEALEILEKNPQDIVLLDYKLPGMTGLDVLSIMAEKKIETMAIMITAYASLETAVVATKQGAFDFLAKPFTPDELRSVIKKATKNLILQRQAKKLAEEKRQVRFQFISVVAHELKAPLAAIEGYLNIMNEGLVTDPTAQHQMVERCLLRLTGMRKMVTDLLDFTRIESGNKVREFVGLDLVEIARQSMETMSSSASARGIKIELVAPETACMTADRGEIEIIFNNLVSNAVKYNRDGGRIIITIAQIPGGFRISVADTGIGMTEEEVGKLFGEFVRIKNVKTKNILGTGLGLSIVKKLALLYGRDVNVESHVDVGSTFNVILMEAQGPQQAS